MTEHETSRFRFVHAADLHLDTPFKGIQSVAPIVAETLREASLRAFDNIINLAIEREATFVVFAGDIYDGSERGLRAQLRFRDGLARLSQHGILSFIVHGNHDPVTTGWSAINNSWPDGVTVFGANEVEMVAISRDQQTIATVQGISYAIRATTENLARRYRRPSLPGFHVGLLHCNVAGAADGYSDYSPCSLNDLRASELDYFALGHVHQRRILHESAGPGDPWVVYCGNSQARSPKPSEQEPKGAMVVEVDGVNVTSIEFVACDLVRFGFRQCSIATFSDIGELEDALIDIANEELEAADGRSIVLRVELTGRGALHDDLSRAGVIDDLTTRLHESVVIRSEHFCWWDRIVDVSNAAIDFDAVRGRGDFAADLLELSDNYLANEYSRRTIGDELVNGVPKAITGALRDIIEDNERLTEIFERATALAFDELLRDAK